MTEFNHSTFCVIPWSSIEIGTFGEYKICQFSGNNSSANTRWETFKKYSTCLDENDKVMTVFTHSIEQAMNSKHSKEIRLAQSEGRRHDHCVSCWSRDDAYLRSNQTTRSVRFYKSFVQLKDEEGVINLDNVKEHATDDGSISKLPISLDLRFTNTCNMKCIMCNPYFSNMWYEDWTKVTGKDYFGSGTNIIKIKKENGVYRADVPPEPWHESSQWFEQLDAIKDRIRHIYITGGEPFIVKGHERLLDTLIKSNLADKIRLEYDTNLSVINPGLVDKLKHFKYVELSVSVDDVGKRYEHIRFPGNFNTLIKNLDEIKKAGHIKIRNISTCVGLYSVFSPVRLYETFKNNYVINIRFLTGPHEVNPAYFPKNIKKQIVEVYKKLQIPDNYKNLMIAFFENNMDVHTDEACIDYIRRFIAYMDKLDSIRGTDWKTTFSEISTLLEEYL